MKQGEQGASMNRRDFLAASAAAALAGCQTSPGRPGAARDKDRPNIVLIMADDMGYETVGAYGGESYHTPYLDELARTGMRFDHAHATPVCTPTRLTLMSGLHNSRNYTGFGEMPAGTRTFAQVLREAGYATCIGGKWQLAGDANAPHEFGFDEYCLWQMTRVRERLTSRYPNPGLEINGRELDFSGGAYGPDIVTEYINSFIERHQNEPFLVYYPMILPHFPFEPTPLSPDWNPESGGVSGAGDTRYFGDMVHYTDRMVGRVVQQLDVLGLRENTLVLFTADNGTYRGIVSRIDGREVVGGKLSSTDAGTHVPMIANWPGVVPPGTVNEDLICFTHFFPTLADVAGVPLPEDLPLDGQSFAPALRGEDAGLRPWLYMWWSRNNDPDGPGGEFARTHRYKLYHDGRFYDLSRDLLEESPLAPESLTPGERQTRDMLRQIIAERTRPGFYERGSSAS